MPGRNSGPTLRRTPAHVLALALTAVLFGGCADQPTLPSAPAAGRAAARSKAGPPARPTPPAAPGTLVLRRTTTPPPGARGRNGRGQTFRIPETALVRRAGIVRVATPAKPAPERPDELPPSAVLELPAAAATALCDGAPTWRRESRAGALTIVTRGRGDEPWSSLETWRDGRLVARSRTVWERGRDRWRLVSHEDATPDGASQTLTVERPRGRDDFAAIPRVRCQDPNAAAVRPTGGSTVADIVAGAAGLAQVGPVGSARLDLRARFAAEDCTGGSEAAEAACRTQLVAVISATAAVVGASAGVWLGCVVPSPVVLATCTQAVTTLTTASAALAIATSVYQDCRESAQTPKPCSCPSNPQDAGVTGTASLAAAHTTLDCAQPPAEGGGGGGGGGQPTGGGNGYWAEICEYIDHYDEDGNYLYTSDLTCRVVWIS